ncbi:MAG: hypothetical protein LJE89_15945 [Deltaproteobacteria bacterium]|nr:hypothetical protein [Deltaproteobacteria bacterium]
MDQRAPLKNWYACCGMEKQSFEPKTPLWLLLHGMSASPMETPYSRKQFLRQTLRQCFRILAKNIDLKDSSPLHQETQCFLDYLTIASDFSPQFLRQEAQRLGLDPESIGQEKLLRAIYENMEEQRQKSGSHGGNAS